VTDTPNAEQITYWNTGEAEHWVDAQDRYDEMLAPFTDALLDVAAILPTDRILDVGCGTGATTCAAAAIAADGTAQGLDISQPMVDAARRRAAAGHVTNVSFTVADAQTEPFSADHDVILSRFGVMFFDDAVAAFSNLRSALAPGGRVAFVCWQPMLTNEWMTVPALAAFAHVAPPTPPADDAPGPFSFGDPDRVRSVLTDAGFEGAAVEAFETRILLGGRGTVDDAVTFLGSTGMSRILLADQPPETVAAAMDSIRTALAPHAGPDGVRLGAAAWIVTTHTT
jgi:SAM-dependent methyltransferase